MPAFTAWLNGLRDETMRGIVVARIKRLERGLDIKWAKALAALLD